MLNASPEELFEAIQENPEFAINHPARELFLLENPDLWQRIEYTARLLQAERSIQSTAPKVSLRVLGYWRLECTRRLLFIHNQYFRQTHSEFFNELYKKTVQHLAGIISQEELLEHAAKNEDTGSAPIVAFGKYPSEAYPESHPLVLDLLRAADASVAMTQAAYDVGNPLHAMDATRWGAWTVYFHAAFVGANGDREYLKERRWQAQRLCELARISLSS